MKTQSYTNIEKAWALSLYESQWLVRPSPSSFTVEQFIGDLAEELSSTDITQLSNTPQFPEIDPENFESATTWFLA